MTDKLHQQNEKGSLKKSEERLKLILEAGEFGMWELDTKTGNVWRTLRHDQIFGYGEPLPHWTYSMFLDHVLPEDRNEVEEKLQNAFSPHAVMDFECRIRRVDGDVRWIWLQGKPLADDQGAIIRITGLVKDITEKKKAEEALRKSEALLKETQEISMTGGWEMDVATNRTTWTDELYRIYGVSKEFDHDDIRTDLSFYDPAHRPLLEQAFRDAVEKGEPYDLELRFLNARGEERWVRTMARPVLNNGRVVRITGNLIDITDRKHAELKLRESRQLIQALIENTTSVVFFKDIGGRITYINSRPEHTLQIPEAGLLGKTAAEIWPPEIAGPIEENDRKVLESGRPMEIEEMIRLEDGDHWFLTTKFPIRDAAEHIIGIGGMSADITRRKVAEQKLQESEERFRIMADNSPLIIWVMNAQGGIEFVNRAFREFFGVAPDQVTRPRWLPLVHPDDAEEYLGAYTHAVEDRKPFRAQARMRRADGQWRWIDSFGAPWFSPQGEFLGYVGSSPDITERMLSEEALKKSEEQYRLTVDGLVDGIHVVDRDLRILLMNSTFRKWSRTLFNFSEEVEGKTIIEFAEAIPMLRKEAPMLKSFYEQVFATGEPNTNEHEFEAGDRKIFLEFRRVPVIDEGRVIRVVTIARDITDRKQAEEDLDRYRSHLEDLVKERTMELEERSAKLRQEIAGRKRIEEAIRTSEEQYRVVVENANEGIVIAQDGEFCLVNPNFAGIVGYPQKELISKRFVDYIHPEDRQMVMDRHRKRMRGEPVPNMYSFRIVDSKKNTKWLEINAVMISWKGRPATLNFLSDVTERVRMEEEKKSMEAQLAQAQKIEALGTFAGGIAHDLNNILYPIIINIEMLLSDAEKGTELHETLSQILTAAYRQRDLVKQILAFSRKSEGKSSPVKVAPLLKETLSLLRASLPSTIQVQLHIDPGPDMVMGDSTQIQQIILNLFRNAADALESHKGTIEVNLTNTRIGADSSHQDLKPGEYLRLTVQDTGRGIPSSIMDRIFEPFFTTKEVGKGIGMGLPVVHGMVKKHGGAITVESTPGTGSLITVLLPVLDESSSAETLSPEVHEQCKENPTILLVDDEQIILSSMQRALERSGYSVVSARSGQEALEIFAINPGRFCLVITDLTMPGVDGRELVRRLMDMRPDVPVILSTGYGDSITEQESQSLGIREMLLKPPNTHELNAAIHRVLQG
jgi:PAS domain S-box-containing protein